jgi:arginyl-tRNA synthetase
MSGRKGLYINADDVFDAVKKSAFVETKKRNPDVGDEQWYDNVSEKLALSAIRFALLKQDLDKTITFDLNESLKLIGETGPYMLYTFARAMSILAKADRLDPALQVKGELLASESEIDLLTIMAKYDIAVEKAVNMLAPKWIAHYSFEACEAFNRFYEKNRVIQVEDANLRFARIRLVEAFSNVLKSALNLLGIDVLPKI